MSVPSPDWSPLARAASAASSGGRKASRLRLKVLLPRADASCYEALEDRNMAGEMPTWGQQRSTADE